MKCAGKKVFGLLRSKNSSVECWCIQIFLKLRIQFSKIYCEFCPSFIVRIEMRVVYALRIKLVWTSLMFILLKVKDVWVNELDIFRMTKNLLSNYWVSVQQR